MPDQHEDLVIRINKDGEVCVEGPDLSPRQLQNYRQLFEDILGQAELRAGSGESLPPPGVQYESHKESEEEETARRQEQEY